MEIMDRDRTTATQRIGMGLAFVEACLLAFVGALHFGFVLHVGDATFAAPFSYPAAIVEELLAFAIVLGLILPGAGGIRAGRVLLAQLMVVIGVFVGQIALMRAAATATAPNEIFYAIALAVALATIALLASPIRRRSPAH